MDPRHDSPDPCADIVRERDRDRYIATLWAPAAARAGLFALHALDLEMLAVVRTTTEPMVGAIRLAWWRERLEGLDAGQVPAQPVLQALAAQVLPAGVTGASLTGLEDGMLALMSDPRDVEAHLTQRGGTLFAAAATLLGGPPGAARLLGEAWAAGELSRTSETVATPAIEPTPRALRPLRALARLGLHDLHATTLEPRGATRRQMSIAVTMLAGR